jgi:hypothetical protein
VRFSPAAKEGGLGEGVKDIFSIGNRIFRIWKKKIKRPLSRLSGGQTDLAARFGQPQLNLDGAAEHLAKRDVHLLDAGGDIRRHHQQMVGEAF